jgi:hypothetical protein
MPGDPRECRKHALRCLQFAKAAISERAKDQFLNLADHWLVLAADLESMQSLIESLKADEATRYK